MEKYDEDPLKSESDATTPDEAEHDYNKDYKVISYFLKNVWPKMKESIKPEDYMNI